jgi:hypothetical protein
MLFDIRIIRTLGCGIEGACQELDRLGARWGDLDKVRGLASRFVATSEHGSLVVWVRLAGAMQAISRRTACYGGPR